MIRCPICDWGVLAEGNKVYAVCSECGFSLYEENKEKIMVDIVTYTPRQRVEEAMLNIMDAIVGIAAVDQKLDTEVITSLVTELIGYTFIRTSNPKALIAVLENEFQKLLKRKGHEDWLINVSEGKDSPLEGE